MKRSVPAEGWILALCIAAFCIAMGLREVVNIWVGTGVAALVSILLLRNRAGDPPRHRFDASPSSFTAGILVGLLLSVATWVLYPVSSEIVPQLLGSPL